MKYTKDQIKVLKDSKLSHESVSIKLNISRDSVRAARRALRVKSEAVPERPKAAQASAKVKADTTVVADLAAHDESYWQGQHGALMKKYNTLLKSETAVQRLVSQAASLAPVQYSPLPSVSPPKARVSDGHPQSAFLMLSDTHIGKVTPSGQTLTFGNYNFDMFMARLKYLEASVLSITQNHVNTRVPELVISMLGDMLDGSLSHGAECGVLSPLFSQCYAGAHVVAQFVRNLAAFFPKVRIYSVVGNHTRMPNQHKMPTKNRFSNFDMFFYALVRELLKGCKNIEWPFDAQPYQLFDVQGYRFFTAHGDHLRGGDKNLGIPNHAIGRMVGTTTQLMVKHGLPSPNYYLVGHLHRDIVLPHGLGSVLVNGGFPGIDEFGLAEMFPPSDPTQKFFFVHPRYGKTATYDISLKLAQAGPSIPTPYSAPNAFPVL